MKNQPTFCPTRKLSLTVLLIFLLGAMLLLPGKTAAQQAGVEFDEIIVTLRGQSIGTAEIPALIIGQQIYLPVTDLFNFLTIKNSLSASAYSISGHLMNPQDIYSINRIDNQIYYKDTLIKLNPNDIIFSSNEFYLNASYLGSVFGLECKFNFRSLTVDFNSKVELPFMREKRLEQMRRNITKIKGEIKADTVIKRKFELAHLGALDWSVTASSFRGDNNMLARIGIGGVVAGGEATAQLYLSNTIPVSLNNQYFLWRYVNNEKKYFKQISLGRVNSPNTFSSIPSLLGVQINNTTTRQRRSFGSYLVSDITEPGWVVELYVNDVLVDYAKADASGLFSFEVPLVYGNSNVKYKFYGPWGEERMSEQLINIPFAFLPKNMVDYSVTAGTTSDSLHNPFTRLHMNYGFSKRITIGSGAEYNSGLYNRKLLPFLNASARLGNAVILFGEYAPGTMLKGAANLRLKNKLQLEAQYIKYAAGQEAIRTTSLQDRKLMASIPFKMKKIVGFSRLTMNYSKFYKGELKTAELLMSATRGRINSNITTYAVFFDRPEILSRLAFNIPLPFNIRLSPQLQYHYQRKDIVMVKAEAEKRAFKNMVATVGYEKNKLIHYSGFTVGLRHNFSFAQVGATARQTGDYMSITQTASGGLLFDGKKITASDRSNVGRGTILVLPFLDYNCNARRDKNEPEVLNLGVRVDGCKIDRSPNKAAVKISALEAYNKYYVLLDDKNFDNPAYKIKHKVIEIISEPNMVKQIVIPVSVVGEAGGYVYVKTNKETRGIGRVIVHIYDEQKNKVAKIITEGDGYFSYLGLIPGKYTAHTDEMQLTKIKMKNDAAPLSFIIKENKEGDIIDNLQLIIESNNDPQP
ncbi:MAG: hypothetical protein H7Y86_16600 [Rhizobacter sp.]|nr:hypothetical protein [Ferruginibacter sp.]